MTMIVKGIKFLFDAAWRLVCIVIGMLVADHIMRMNVDFAPYVLIAAVNGAGALAGLLVSHIIDKAMLRILTAVIVFWCFLPRLKNTREMLLFYLNRKK